MSIKNYVDELEQIHLEIKRNNIRNKTLRDRAKVLENDIANYLSEKGQPGLKYRDKAIVVESKEKRALKKKKERETDVIELLKDLGVNEPENAYNRLLDVQKGITIEETKIKFKKIPKSMK